MGIITLIASILFLLLSVKDNKNKIITPKTLFYLLWTFILFLSDLNLYNIIKPSTYAYYLIFLMLVFFYIGCLCSKFSFKKKNKVIEVLKEITNKYREKINQNPKFLIIYILAILYIVFALIDCYIVVKNYINGVPMYEIRRWRMGTFGVDLNPILNRRSFIEEVFRSVILAPFENLLPPIAAYCFFDSSISKKHKYSIPILSVIVLIVSCIAGGGGRLGFIYFFGSYFFMFLIFFLI